MRTCLFAVLFLALAMGLTPVKQETAKILWSSTYKLKWHDFKGNPDQKEIKGQQSATKTRIEITTQVVKGKIIFNVPCYFQKAISWTINDTNLHLLQHEQLHFDIAELHARLLRSKVHQAGTIKESELRSFVKDVYHEVIKTCVQFQIKYDTETDHSRNREAQKKWNNKVKNLLLQSNNYSSNKVTVIKS